MLFKTAIISAVTLFCANGAMAAAVDPRMALIATTAFAACNCPNNCEHKAGSDCKFYSGPSSKSDVLKGKCAKPNGNPYASIECIPN
ncbi:hypothetical protein K449DRAFT_440796 [Hypoxylon sp. EC38]|nr:hypothetical protein K449DRAFT_440796 [Hypoxylon sp. EC38]